ncbi:hypothetical protein [Sutcliffiella horikoshii]|uniref:Uncharacterized protein n=1 Tax=Sutcliffiella horikoshii TaxID=79883 RepID=A0A5D4TA33_9BACI|nr:hypothetical protein [Sutcliffiella horikoshii]TYS71126.1 hypothetical protein FZC75_13900 [Sutcliffiella horikoshii]
MKRPIGVSLISYFYIFGAMVLLFTAVFYNAEANSISIAERFGLTIVPDRLMRLLVALISLGMVYGYIRLKKWGYWIMITYSVLFGIISLLLLSNQPYQPFIGNVIFSIIVLAYTICVKKEFFKTDFQH